MPQIQHRRSKVRCENSFHPSGWKLQGPRLVNIYVFAVRGIKIWRAQGLFIPCPIQAESSKDMLLYQGQSGI